MKSDFIESNLLVKRLTDFAQIEMLYHDRLKKDFDTHELRPLSSIKQLWVKKAYDCYGLFDGDQIFGYAFFFRIGGNYLFDYFAIASGYRGQGLGSFFLKHLTASLADAYCVMGEVEDPAKASDEATKAIRERRIQFYLRSGVLTTELTSVVFGEDYLIMEQPLAVSHSTEELKLIYSEFYRNLLPPIYFRTQFSVTSK